ncbi:MAG TPA: citrate lyase acyl carrier protein [Candidatus Blautia merdavium]|uniref:Citrate lyase acyl carrier protein n=1 Tax=Candidatus Blautia merdavium TaxID=2838494 RepID=A0A9D2PKY0_9FIRM|nr:citrate lyase acyl carrier protein [Candidatus Blautia merdavium]
MKIIRNAVAGTLESSDLFIQVEPDEKELHLEIDSVVANQYMNAIRAAVMKTLDEFHVTTGKIFIKDKGALDCVICARMETALKRGGVEES